MKRQRSGSDFKRVGKLNNQGTLELGFGCHHVVAVTRLAGDNFTTPYIRPAVEWESTRSLDQRYSSSSSSHVAYQETQQVRGG